MQVFFKGITKKNKRIHRFFYLLTKIKISELLPLLEAEASWEVSASASFLLNTCIY